MEDGDREEEGIKRDENKMEISDKLTVFSHL